MYLNRQCDHKEERWIEKSYIDWDGNEVDSSEWLVYPSFEDIDLHRMKCTKCGKIEYYSGAAKAYYEEGKPSIYIGGLK